MDDRSVETRNQRRGRQARTTRALARCSLVIASAWEISLEIVRFLEDFDAKMELGGTDEYRFDAARRASKKTEARALAEQLLARQDLPPDLRTFLQQQATAK